MLAGDNGNENRHLGGERTASETPPTPTEEESLELDPDVIVAMPDTNILIHQIEEGIGISSRNSSSCSSHSSSQSEEDDDEDRTQHQRVTEITYTYSDAEEDDAEAELTGDGDDEAELISITNTEDHEQDDVDDDDDDENISMGSGDNNNDSDMDDDMSYDQEEFGPVPVSTLINALSPAPTPKSFPHEDMLLTGTQPPLNHPTQHHVPPLTMKTLQQDDNDCHEVGNDPDPREDKTCRHERSNANTGTNERFNNNNDNTLDDSQDGEIANLATSRGISKTSYHNTDLTKKPQELDNNLTGTAMHMTKDNNIHVHNNTDMATLTTPSVSPDNKSPNRKFLGRPQSFDMVEDTTNCATNSITTTSATATVIATATAIDNANIVMTPEPHIAKQLKSRSSTRLDNDRDDFDCVGASPPPPPTHNLMDDDNTFLSMSANNTDGLELQLDLDLGGLGHEYDFGRDSLNNSMNMRQSDSTHHHGSGSRRRCRSRNNTSASNSNIRESSPRSNDAMDNLNLGLSIPLTRSSNRMNLGMDGNGGNGAGNCNGGVAEKINIHMTPRTSTTLEHKAAGADMEGLSISPLRKSREEVKEQNDHDLPQCLPSSLSSIATTRNAHMNKKNASRAEPRLSVSDENNILSPPLLPSPASASAPPSLSPLSPPPPQPLAASPLRSQPRSMRSGIAKQLSQSCPTNMPSAAAAVAFSHSSLDVSLTLFALPMDAIHCLCTFLEVKELTHFGLINRSAALSCREVIRRVKMHGFKCAVEVVTTWNRGQHADAKELAALYIQCGVPIYPAPLGHAYHTLYWRMKVEADTMKSDDDSDSDGGEDEGDDNNNTAARASTTERKNKKTLEVRNGQVDRFYLERHEARNISGPPGGYYLPSLTYLEEKGLYWRSKLNGISTKLTEEQRQNYIQHFNIRPPPPPMADSFGFLGFYDDDDDDLPNLAEQRRIIGIGENVALGPGDADFVHIPEIAAMRGSDNNFPIVQHQHHTNQLGGSLRSSSGSAHANAISNSRQRAEDIATVNATQPKRSYKEPKIVLHYHKHLVDRHLQGKAAICCELGNMDANPITLSADFFHPVLSRTYPVGVGGRNRNRNRQQNQQSEVLSTYNGSETNSNTNRSLNNSRHGHGHGHGMARPPSRRSDREPQYARMNSNPLPQTSATTAAHTNTNTSSTSTNLSPMISFVDHCVMLDLELHCYDSESGDDYDRALRRSFHSQLRNTTFTPTIPMEQAKEMIQRYERKLNSLLQRGDGDYAAFDEHMLDFWDEFFPCTETVHFFDQHTPVPRMSKLHRFLTRPCPKAFGTMQCEIERIRVRYRTKGMMTGRYYSTYEYRLFIRDRRKPNYDGSLVDGSGYGGFLPRMDTVLMAAKYRGKHYSGPNGLVPLTNGKKGVNHYFLYMPHQSDIDEHLDLANDLIENEAFRYKQEVPAAGSILELCRLQTNYMGTEFQISSPCALKYGRKALEDTAIGMSRDRDDDDEKDNDRMTRPFSIKSAPASTSALENFAASESITGTGTGTGTGGSNGTGPSSKSKKWFNNPFKKKRDRQQKRKSKKDRKGSARISPWSKHSLKSSKKASKRSLSNPDIYQAPVLEEREIGAITYTANVLGNRPRIMNVCIPKICNETELPIAEVDVWTKIPGEDGSMLNRLKEIQQTEAGDGANSQISEQALASTSHSHRSLHPENDEEDPSVSASDLNMIDDQNFSLTSLQNRPPWWNGDLGAFVLNFGGRVSVASVKNFQLCDRDDHNNIMLQFGRIEGRHSFTMDFSYPLSPVQAFAVSISSLQSKISFA